MRDVPHILIVDDSPDSLGMLADALTIEGVETRIAQSGREAFQAVDERRPDVILMDAMMPGLDGFTTCEILRTEKGLQDTPIIFMTGYEESEHVVRAFEAGGVDFIAKPVSLDQLFVRIRVHLANARKARSARLALDATGRRIVSVSAAGDIEWFTPQAAKLLERAGLRAEENARLPFEVVDFITREAEQGATSIRIDRGGNCVEFRILNREPGGETFLRLVDCKGGTEEERLASAFDLTLREAEVLLWITHGKANKEIAEILAMSPRTVNKHLEQIYTKLGIENRTAAATMAVRVLWENG